MPTRARCIEAHVKFVDPLRYDLEDLRDGMACDVESGEGNPVYIDALLSDVRTLRESMKDGSYRFGRGDLYFYADHQAVLMPFIRTFYIVNQMHLEGLDVPEGRQSLSTHRQPADVVMQSTV